MPPGRANVLLAIVHLYALHGRVTIREICALTGLRSTSTVHAHLWSLRNEGLIVWEPETQGTLRPAVTSVTV